MDWRRTGLEGESGMDRGRDLKERQVVDETVEGRDRSMGDKSGSHGRVGFTSRLRRYVVTQHCVA
jgi:hypothetical protein